MKKDNTALLKAFQKITKGMLIVLIAAAIVDFAYFTWVYPVWDAPKPMQLLIMLLFICWMLNPVGQVALMGMVLALVGKQWKKARWFLCAFLLATAAWILPMSPMVQATGGA